MSDDEIVIPGGRDIWSGPYPPFSIGGRHTVFEWCMTYTDRHPLGGAALLYPDGNHNLPTLKAMDERLAQLGATEEWRGRSYGAPEGTTGNPTDRENGPDEFLRDIAPHVLLGPLPPPPHPMDVGKDSAAVITQVRLPLRPLQHLPVYPQTDDPAWTSNEVYRALVAEIKAGEIKTDLVYLRDQTALPDYTLCVIDIGPVLKLARRRGDYGAAIAQLLAIDTAGTTQEQQPAASIENLAEWIFAQHPFRLSYEALLGKATHHDQLGGFRKTDFLAAYHMVYETKPHRRPITGWPLRSPYKERFTQG